MGKRKSDKSVVKAEVGDEAIALDSKHQGKLNETLRKVNKKKNTQTESEKEITRGIILLKHIPFGFFENELRGYFSQFGKVLRLRHARSKKTGRSRGYAFIEFEFEDVAKIAAESINGYLMYERLLKCEVLPPDVDAKKIFRSRFITAKNFPKLKARKYSVKQEVARLKSPEEQKKLLETRVRKLTEQNEKLASLGINYQFKIPVPKKTKSEAN